MKRIILMFIFATYNLCAMSEQEKMLLSNTKIPLSLVDFDILLHHNGFSQFNTATELPHRLGNEPNLLHFTTTIDLATRQHNARADVWCGINKKTLVQIILCKQPQAIEILKKTGYLQ